LFLIHNLLSCISLEKVHACAWRCSTFEIQHVGTLLDKGDRLRPNLVVNLALSLVDRPILAVAHLVTLGLARVPRAHMLEVILVLIQTRLGNVPRLLIGVALLALATLTAQWSHALLPVVVIVVILCNDSVVNVVHVLLL
jgi:hypothetical protein